MQKQTSSRTETDGVLDRQAAAWDARDSQSFAALFADDGVYAASIGPDPGTRAQGPAAIAALASHMFDIDDGATSELITRVPTASGAFWSWRSDLLDGTVALGCDLFIVRDGFVVLKDAYRKVRRT